MTYTFTDYLAQTLSNSYTIMVTKSDSPVLTENLVLPKYFIDGVSYELPELTATSYIGETIKIQPNIYVTDSDGRHLVNDTTYQAKVAVDKEEILVEYVYAANNGESTTVSQVVKGVVAKEGNRISLDKYFVGDNVAFDKDDSSVIASTDKSGSGFMFVKPLYSDNLNFNFSITPEQFNAESFKLSITDMYDGQKTVVFNFRFDATTNSLFCSLNGNLEKKMKTTLIEDGKEVSFAVKYDVLLNVWEDISGLPFENATTYANGEEFEGFSEFVYFDIQFGKVTNASSLNVKQLNNQPFNNFTRDVIEPEVMVDGEISTAVSLGGTIAIPTMQAYDVLGYVVSKKLSVQYSFNGKISHIKDENGLLLNGVDASQVYNIRLDQYGEYIVTYTAEDNSGRKVNVIKNIAMLDKEKPQVEVVNSYESEYRLNQVIIIHAMMTQDNLTAEENLKKLIYVIDANGKMHRLNAGDRYKFVLYGKHVVRYFVLDEAGNITMVDYVIMVKEKEEL